MQDTTFDRMKEFFQISREKIGITLGFLALSIGLGLIFSYQYVPGISFVRRILSFPLSLIVEYGTQLLFETFPTSIAGLSVFLGILIFGVILQVAYWYVLSCVVVYLIKTPEN